MNPNDADGMANSVDPDQTAPLGAVWSGSALFAQAYLSEILGSLRYSKFSGVQTFRIFTVNIISVDLFSAQTAGQICLVTKPTKWSVRPVKTQISLGICPVWSVFAVHSMGS